MTTYTLIREAFPFARKQHRCIWCGESITIGTKHRYEVSTFDGLQNHRWHLECDAAAADYFNSGDGPEFAPHENERPPSSSGSAKQGDASPTAPASPPAPD